MMKNLLLSLASALAITAVATPALAKDLKSDRCKAATRYSNLRRGFAVYVLDHGKVVCDTYRNAPDTPHELWSGTKSFVGVMAAAAVQDGLLTLDEPAADTLTEWRDEPRKRPTTIRQLLSMTGGQPSAIGKPPSYGDSVKVDLTADPGTRFQYGPTPIQIFGEIMKRKLLAAGQPGNPLAYLERRILDPVGIEYARWRDGKDGNPLLPQGAVMTAAQWAKFGEFIRAGGRVDGKMIVDPDAFAALFRGSEVNPDYGLTWWLPNPYPDPGDPITAATDIGARAEELPDDMVLAAGAGGQRMYVIPSLGITIVRQAKLDIAAIMAAARGKKPEHPWSDADFVELLIGKRGE